MKPPNFKILGIGFVILDEENDKVNGVRRLDFLLTTVT